MKFQLNREKTLIYIHDKRYNLKAEFDKQQIRELLKILPMYLKRMK